VKTHKLGSQKMILNLMKLALPQDAAGMAEGLGGGSLVNMLLMFGVVFLVFYFMVIRPERKRRKKMDDMIGGLSAGDRIVTIGGVHGSVVGVTEKTVIVRVAEQVKIEINRQAVGTVVTPEGEVVTADEKK
jgi:preprotein translocase subunit YajC